MKKLKTSQKSKKKKKKKCSKFGFLKAMRTGSWDRLFFFFGLTAQVKTEGIIQIDFEYQGDKFWRLVASELSFMGSIAYFDKHSVWIKVCMIAYNYLAACHFDDDLLVSLCNHDSNVSVDW